VRISHYSGHSSYVADQNGDEPEGRDECLVPCGYKSAGFITDDVLKILYDGYPTTGNLTLVMDSCHSGTVNKAPAEDIVFRFLPVSDAEQEKIDAAATKFVQDQHEYVFKAIQQAKGQISYRQLADRVGKKLKSGNYSQIPQLEYAGQRDQAPIFRPFA
jgi:hypothetical protein